MGERREVLERDHFIIGLLREQQDYEDADIRNFLDLPDGAPIPTPDEIAAARKARTA